MEANVKKVFRAVIHSIEDAAATIGAFLVKVAKDIVRVV